MNGNHLNAQLEGGCGVGVKQGRGHPKQSMDNPMDDELLFDNEIGLCRLSEATLGPLIHLKPLGTDSSSESACRKILKK